jgi:hypothetical protein
MTSTEPDFAFGMLVAVLAKTARATCSASRRSDFAVSSAGGVVRAVDLDDPLPLSDQESGETGPIEPSAFNADGPDRAVRAHPCQEIRLSCGIRGELSAA